MSLEATQNRLSTQMKSLNDQRVQLEDTLKQQLEVLEQASGMSRDEASQQLMTALETELENERGMVVLRHQKSLEDRIQSQAREMLLTAIQRYVPRCNRRSKGV